MTTNYCPPILASRVVLDHGFLFRKKGRNQFIDYMTRAGSEDVDESMCASLLEMAQLRHVGVDVLEPLVEAWRASRGSALEPPLSALPAATTGKRHAEPEPEPEGAPMSAKARGKRPM